jgi:cyclopropane fatty-acyl-phospholipid synthase-like methyltransferase
MSAHGTFSLLPLALAAALSVSAQTAPPAPLDPDSLQRPGVLIREMKLQPGMTIADIGTGIGNMLPLLSRRVGPTGRVLAEDTEDEFLAAAKDSAANQGLDNITFIKGTDTDPKLPEGQVDIVFALDVYHHFSKPENMLAAFYKALRPDGRLIIVEYYKRETAMPDGKALTRIRLDLPDMIKELEANHFHLIEEKEHTKNVQYMLILEKS